MIGVLRKFTKWFEYYGNCRHGSGGDDFALGPCTIIRLVVGTMFQIEQKWIVPKQNRNIS